MSGNSIVDKKLCIYLRYKTVRLGPLRNENYSGNVECSVKSVGYESGKKYRPMSACADYAG